MSAWSLRIPLRFLRGNAARLVLSVIALACGVALVCAVDLVNGAVLRAFTDIVDTMAGRAALQVSAGEGGLLPEEVAATVAAVPGVELAVPVVSATAFTADESGELLTVHGIDVTHEASVRVYEASDAHGLVDDPLEFLSQPDSILLTRAFAERRGLAVGDQLILVTPSGNRPFTVRGLLNPSGVARVYGGSLVVMDLFAAEAAFTRAGFVNRVDVVVERQADVGRVRDALAATLPTGLEVTAPAQRRADIQRVVQSMQVILRAMGLVALVAAFLIAFNRLAAVFEARTWQLGIMKAVGARSRTVWRELLKESLLLGTVGVLLGIPLGIALGHALLPVIATMTALNSKIVAPEAALVVHPWSLLVSAFLGIGAAALAAALPAWRAARLPAAETLRGRGGELAERSSRAMWLARALVATACGVAIGLQVLTREATWGLVATGLVAVATALAARPLLAAAQRPLGAVLELLPRGTGRFAARAIMRNPRRSALTIGMLGVGIGSVVWFWVLAASFERSVIDTLGRAFRADLVLSSSHIASGFDDSPVDGALVQEVAGLPGVRTVIGERIVDWRYGGGPIAIDAFDPAYFTGADFGRWVLLGDRLPDVWDTVARGEAVIVSTSFVRNLGVAVGDRLLLDTPSGPLAVTVGGVTSAFASPRGTIELSRAVYERSWHDGQVTRVHLHLAPGTETAAVRAAVARQVGNRYRLRILSAAELLDYWTVQVRRAFAGLHAMAAMVLLVILIGMADTLAAGVTERTRELGVVRAVGGRRRSVGGMIVAEGLVLGVLGLTLAASAGLVLAWLWVDGTLPLLLGWVLQLHVPMGTIAAVGAATLVVCMLAAALPARQAARLEPTAALRYE